MLAILALLVSATATGSNDHGLPEPLAPFKARFQVTDGSSRLGHADIGLEADEGGWRYYSRVEPEGLYALLIGKVTDTAWLEVHEQEMRPLRFEHREDDKKKHTRIEFDWSADKARVKRHGGNETLPLESGTQDQLSAMLTVIQAFAAGEQRLEVPSIDDNGESEPLVFAHAGTTSIKTPAGTFDTVRVRRIRENSKRETDSWLAPALNWVPVRIDQRKNGDLVARMELVGLNGDNADLSVDPPR